MRKLMILSVLSLSTVGTSGCFHNCCGPGWGGGLFAKRAPQPAAAMPCYQPQTVQCCQPCCPPPCCDPCGGMTSVGMSGGMTTTTMSPVMPTVPCCQ